MHVGLILLAAGGSRRLGQAKQLLRFGERTLLRHTADVALASVCRPVVVVLGAERERCAVELNPLPVVLAWNSQWAEGMAGSIHVGLERLLERNDRVEAVVICLCDQPRLSPAVIDGLVSQFEKSDASVVFSAYAGTLGAPALIARAHFEDLRALRGDEGARRLLRHPKASITSVQFSGGEEDVDTPEDYLRLRATQ